MEIIGNKVIVLSSVLRDQVKDQPQQVIRLLQSQAPSLSIDQLHVDSSGRVIIDNEELARSLSDDAVRGLQASASDYTQTNNSCAHLNNNYCSSLDNDNCYGIKNQSCS